MQRKIRRRLGGVLLAWAVIVALHFPWGVDGPHAPTELIDDADQFYEAAYEVDAEQEQGDSRYVRIANLTAHNADVLASAASRAAMMSCACPAIWRVWRIRVRTRAATIATTTPPMTYPMIHPVVTPTVLSSTLASTKEAPVSPAAAW